MFISVQVTPIVFASFVHMSDSLRPTVRVVADRLQQWLRSTLTVVATAAAAVSGHA